MQVGSETPDVFAWLSIGECIRSSDGSLVPVDVARPETTRYCIDQAELAGKKDAWIAGASSLPVPNVKRKLASLRFQARALQRKKDALKQSNPGRYKHLSPYFVVRREWQRCWRKIRHMHDEIAKQVATRIVSACKLHGFDLLRFEDLSWSSHSSRRDAGAWLSWWQVHWFFSKVQEVAIRLARLEGICVELVNARGTSRRCSSCGVEGDRKGQTFTCINPRCGKSLDSDLNAARNVRVAPTSPRLHAAGPGARYRPLACHATTSPNFEDHGQATSDVQYFQSLT